jgi:peptide/nickel transport system ATP-binding protein
MSEGAPLLELCDLSVEIPTRRGPARVLNRVSFTLRRDESLGIVGESGSGKTMAALAVMGLLPTAARATGAVRLDGRDLLGADEASWCRVRGRRIAMVFQEPATALNPVRSIGAQVAESMRLHLALGRAEAEARALRLLARVGLPAPRFSPDLYPHQLSGGQRQRVMIAAALACDPDILIADEPTTALDVTIQAQILDLIAELAGETGMAVILVSHDLGVIAESTDRALVMYAGSVVEAAPTAALFARMAHPYSCGLFAASPHMAALAAGAAGGRIRLAAIPGQMPDPAALPKGCSYAERCPNCQADCRTAAPMLFAMGPEHGAACYHPMP